MSDPNVFAHECPLCNQYFPSRSKLLTHERNKHHNNKIIPPRTSLILPSIELIVYYQDAFIVLIKKRLGFNRHSIGSKRLSIDAFPETIFVHLFENEPTFRYSPTQRKYYCQFRQDPKTKTMGYVLFVDYKGAYKVNFSWYLDIFLYFINTMKN